MKFSNGCFEAAYGFLIQVFHRTVNGNPGSPGKGTKGFNKCRKTIVPFIYFTVINHRKSADGECKEGYGQQKQFYFCLKEKKNYYGAYSQREENSS